MRYLDGIYTHDSVRERGTEVLRRSMSRTLCDAALIVSIFGIIVANGLGNYWNVIAGFSA